MPLNYDFSKCSKLVDKTTDHERYTFSTIMMSCSMRKLTEKNFLEFLDRVAIHQLFVGYELIKLNKTNKKWLKRFIGASFNISQMTMRQWFSQKFKQRERYDYHAMTKASVDYDGDNLDEDLDADDVAEAQSQDLRFTRI